MRMNEKTGSQNLESTFQYLQNLSDSSFRFFLVHLRPFLGYLVDISISTNFKQFFLLFCD